MSNDYWGRPIDPSQNPEGDASAQADQDATRQANQPPASQDQPTYGEPVYGQDSGQTPLSSNELITASRALRPA